jgi:hypothetical protein
MQPITVGIICATIIIGAALLGASVEEAESATNKFQIAPQANSGNVWVLNAGTGQLRLCLPPEEIGGIPDCGPWGE